VDSVESLSIQRVTKDGKKDIEDVVTKELSLTIILNNKELTTLLCSPTDLEYLVVGFLFSEGWLKGKDDIKEIVVDEQGGVARVETVGDKELAPDDLFRQSKIESQTAISGVAVFPLVQEFQHRSQVYRMTGGVHSAALCDTKNILLFREDIGRHNAIDKVLGECLLKDMPVDEGIMITSGRVSSEILLKVAKRNIPILISKSAPTDLGVRLAHDLGITLIGFVRGERMNVYANGWRVITNGRY